MAAHRDSLGMVFTSPNSDRRRKRRPGAKSSTFIFTDTAKLSERGKRWGCHSHYVILYINRTLIKIRLAGHRERREKSGLKLIN